MNIDVVTSEDVNSQGGGHFPPSTGLTSDALPEVQQPDLVKNSNTGVSTKNALSGTSTREYKSHDNNQSHWYALRTTYGREKKHTTLL